jgi:hypothetical protein
MQVPNPAVIEQRRSKVFKFVRSSGDGFTLCAHRKHAYQAVAIAGACYWVACCCTCIQHNPVTGTSLHWLFTYQHACVQSIHYVSKALQMIAPALLHITVSIASCVWAEQHGHRAIVHLEKQNSSLGHKLMVLNAVWVLEYLKEEVAAVMLAKLSTELYRLLQTLLCMRECYNSSSKLLQKMRSNYSQILLLNR